MILFIDNYDSFTYNLVQYIGELGETIEVYRNNEITLLDIEAKKPSYIVISPGPCSPNEAGISLEVIKKFAGKIPILGVCLGHQSIVQAFGGKIVRAKKLMHGKTSSILHNGDRVFEGIPSPFKATRYHSLIAEAPVPSDLIVTATTADGEIMGVRHKEYPIVGLQFHPESILTEYGKEMLRNFLDHYRVMNNEMDVKPSTC